MPGRSLISLISTTFWRLRASADFFCELLGVCEIDDAVIVTLGVNKLDLDCADVAIDAGPAFLRRRGCLHRTTNGHSPVVRVSGALGAHAKIPLRASALRAARDGSEERRSQSASGF